MMFNFLNLCALVVVITFPLFIWIGIEQGNTPPERVIPHPKTADEFLLRGKLFEKNGDPEKALQDFTQVVTLRPNDEDGYIWQGLVLEGLHRHHDALQQYQKAKAISQSQGDHNGVKVADFLIQKLNQRK